MADHVISRTPHCKAITSQSQTRSGRLHRTNDKYTNTHTHSDSVVYILAPVYNAGSLSGGNFGREPSVSHASSNRFFKNGL
ncbi:hypothetical protein RRG08_009757 [Elysia crispata]|uniref:Uncharacterized protein n=1 Tax=Elysia crispata TaxID=231223 RepID=A0AAE1D6W4_9GAST|nr:hypothetical protein RRG08_009757 [Elysia crispata]